MPWALSIAYALIASGCGETKEETQAGPGAPSGKPDQISFPKAPGSVEDAGSATGTCMDALEKLKPSRDDAELARYYENLPELLTTSKIVPVVYLKKPYH